VGACRQKRFTLEATFMPGGKRFVIEAGHFGKVARPSEPTICCDDPDRLLSSRAQEETEHMSKNTSLGFAVLAATLIACQPTSAIAGEPAPKKASTPKAASSSSTTTKTTTADPSKLKIEVGRVGLQETNFVEIFGEVHNNTGQAIEYVTVHIDLLDKAGNPLDVGGWHREVHNAETARGEIHYVPAGGSTPFHYIRDAAKIKGTYGGHRLTVTARARSSSAPMPTAAIEGLTTKNSDLGQVDLKGTLKVTGSVDCRSPMALVGFYDDKGKLVDLVTPHHSALEGYFQKKLAAGQSVAFEGKSFPFGANPTTDQRKTKVWAICDNWISE
jgi:hypothetical protein